MTRPRTVSKDTGRKGIYQSIFAILILIVGIPAGFDFNRVVQKTIRGQHLRKAIWAGDIATLRKMKMGGVDIEFIHKERSLSSLVKAAQLGRTQVVRFLVGEGVAVDPEDVSGMTPLYFACDNDNIETVGVLLEAGASVDKARTNDRYTPLMVAAHHDHSDVVRLLLRHGANITLRNSDNKTAEQIARESGSKESAAILKQHMQKSAGKSRRILR